MVAIHFVTTASRQDVEPTAPYLVGAGDFFLGIKAFQSWTENLTLSSDTSSVQNMVLNWRQRQFCFRFQFLSSIIIQMFHFLHRMNALLTFAAIFCWQMLIILVSLQWTEWMGWFMMLLIMCEILVFRFGAIEVFLLQGILGSFAWFLLQGWAVTEEIFIFYTAWPLKMGPMRFPETSLRNYQTRPINFFYKMTNKSTIAINL